MSVFKFGNTLIKKSDDTLESALAAAYESKERPLCMCFNDGVQMYVAKLNDHHVIKRMPMSGHKHSTECDSYDPPPEISGLGDVLGQAIIEDIEDGSTSLKLDYSMSKGAARKAPAQTDKESDTVRTDGKKLTLRGTLHYLWHKSQLDRWYPAMEGKRSWNVVRREILEAAIGVSAKGENLTDLLYIPETFNLDNKDAIVARRNKHTSRAIVNGKKKDFMMVIGEVKAFEVSRYGHKAVIKHLPDFHFMIADDLWKRMNKWFELELELYSILDNIHLIMMGTFSVGLSGFASLESMTLMIVDEHWLPFENKSEYDLISLLVREKRQFTKGLRYNMDSKRPLATVSLNDAHEPTAMYVLPQVKHEDYETAFKLLIEDSHMAHWIYDLDSIMPELPPKK